MSRTFPALAAALVAGSLCAQTVIIPSGFATPGGTTQNLFQVAGINRFQAVYDSTNFVLEHVGQPITITGVEFQMGNGIASPATSYPSVEIYLQNSAVDFTAVTTTFTTQRSVAFPTTPNFSGAVTQNAAAGTTPNTYVMNIPLTTPFVYTPEAGVDLLVEIVINGAPVPTPLVANTSFASTFSFPAHRARAVRSPGTIASATGTLSAFAPAIRFTYASAPNSAKEEPYGVGCGLSSRSFYEQFAGSANDLGGKTVTMTQNLAGGYDATTTVGASLITPTGVALTLGDDVVSAAIPLPFTFDYPGGSTTQIFVDSNGSVLLNGTQGSNIGGSGANFMAAPGHRLSPSMQDLLPTDALDPNSAGNVFAEADPANPTSVFLISWIGVPCFGAGQPSNFQVVLTDNGTADTAKFVYQNLRNNSTSNAGVAVTGFCANPGSVNAGSKDLTAGTISTVFPERGNLTISASGRPVINTAINITTSNIPATGVSLLFFSATQVNPGVDLGFIGMTGGCNAYIVLPEFLSFLNLGTPTFVTNVPVPNDPLLVGAVAFAQAGALDPAFNAFGAVASNGLRLEIGNN